MYYKRGLLSGSSFVSCILLMQPDSTHIRNFAPGNVDDVDAIERLVASLIKKKLYSTEAWKVPVPCLA